MTEEVTVTIDTAKVKGFLYVPEGASGIVIFAHGSGSSRFSSRNQYVASIMQQSGLGTLLFDLLTPEEEDVDNVTREFRFNIPFLARRVNSVTEWLKKKEAYKHLKVGYFGASTGGGAAVVAAANANSNLHVQAVVSRGGRPDLADKECLKNLRVPTLFIIGGLDKTVIDLNRQAFAKLEKVQEKEIKIVPGATHLFEEEGKLTEAAEIAKDWFLKYLNTEQQQQSEQKSP